MKLNTFKHLSRHRFKVCFNLMCGTKNKEYSRNNDKLHNFKCAGRLLDTTPEFALLGMFSKHMVSIIDIVDDIPDLPDYSLLEEKITDAINYLVLLEALVKERIDH